MKVFLLFFFSLLSLPLCAQVDLEVTVRDLISNKTLGGFQVFLTNEQLGMERMVRTDLNGQALFRGLPEGGPYQVLLPNLSGYYPALRDGIMLRAGEEAAVQIGLYPRNQELPEAEINFRANRINTRNAEVAFELPSQTLRELPVEGRDITRALYRLPNVVQATGFYPEAPNIGINGANPLYTSYLIDGMDNNERFLGGQKFAIPVGFVENISVLTNNYSAEYGMTANGVVNITSRSGSNDFTGEAFFLSRPGPIIDGKSDFAQRDLSGNFVKDGFQRYQAGFALGGALKKDKTFYFINAEQTLDLKDNLLNVPDLAVNETIRGQNRFSYLSGKIDHKWNKRWRSSLRGNLGLVNIQRQGGGLEGGATFPSAANSQDRNSFLLASRNTYVGDNFTSQTNVQYARFRWNYGRSLAEREQVTVLSPQSTTIAILGNAGFVFDQLENTFQIQQRFNYTWKQHRFKAGGSLISGRHRLAQGGNPQGNYLVRLDSSQLANLRDQNLGSALSINDIPTDVEVLNYGVELRPNSFGATQNVLSLYLEDSWQATEQLNVLLGLRYDYDNLSRGASQGPGDVNNFGPRAQLNYSLNNSSSLRLGYGLFYDKIPYAVYSDALQLNTNSADYKTQLQELVDLGILPADTDIEAITFEGTFTANISDVDYLQGPSADELQDNREGRFSNERRIISPFGYDNPYSHQFMLGYQWQFAPQQLFFVDIMHNRSHNLPRLRNLNAAEPYPITDADNVEVRSIAEADATRPIPIVNQNYALIDGQQVTGVARNVMVTETAGQSRYYAATFNLQKSREEGEPISYRLHYTWSFLENNTEDINFRAMDANNFEAEWGPSINDRRHLINGLLFWHPTEALRISVAALLQSGQPINRIPDASLYGTADLNGDGQSFGDAYVGNSDRHPGESRNSDRLPWANTFDIGLLYRFKLGSKGNVELSADVFNLFNAQNLSGYSNNATQSNQIQVSSAASGLLRRRNAGAPRQFQFGLRYFW